MNLRSFSAAIFVIVTASALTGCSVSVHTSSSGSQSAVQVEQALEQAVAQGLSSQAHVSVQVRCPPGGLPMKGGVLHCTARAPSSAYTLTVTASDSKGHLRYVANPAKSSAAVLNRVLLSGAQVGNGYVLDAGQDALGLGAATLNDCGLRFPSEALRTDRLQVNYLPTGNAPAVSNEVVTYKGGGAQQALREASHEVCPRAPMQLPPGQGPGRVSYRIEQLHASHLLPGGVALILHVSGISNGRRNKGDIVAIFQGRGNVLSGVYVGSGRLAEDERIAAHAAAASATNLSRL